MTDLRRSEFLRLSAFLAGGTAVGGSSFLAACGPGGDDDDSPSAGSAADETGDLEVFTWRGFEDKKLWRGYAKKYPNKPPKFPQFIDSDDQALAKVRSGLDPDVAQPSVGHAQDFANIDMVQPWDSKLIAVYDNLRPETLEYGQIDGKQISLPTDFGYHSPMYRADLVEPKEESWGVIFDDRYKGKITWYDNAGDFLMMTALFLGMDDPLNMTDDELEEIKKFLVEKKKLVRNFSTSPTDLAADFKQGNVVAASTLSYVFPMLLAEDVDVVYMQPKEGRVAWSDGFLLMKDTDQYHHAHDYVNAWLSPESAQYELEVFGLIPLNSDVDLSKLDPKVVDGLGLDTPESFQPPKAHFLGYIERRDAYGKVWDEIKAA
jgi:spermidine/putrescine transport system substrate-binding protein